MGLLGSSGLAMSSDSTKRKRDEDDDDDTGQFKYRSAWPKTLPQLESQILRFWKPASNLPQKAQPDKFPLDTKNLKAINRILSGTKAGFKWQMILRM